jgi:hypothetical protein
LDFKRTAVVVWAALLLPAAALAQSGTSTIAGAVTDSTAGALPGVAVRVVNEDTGVAVETFTNEEGQYRVTALVPGTYRVETMLDGFDPVIRRPITLQVSQTLAVDITLAAAGPELPSDQRTLSRWFNTGAFANPALFTFGNSPRSVLRGPGIMTTDLTLEKTIGLGGNRRFDVRVEAYNLFNRVNFNIPGFTLGAADFGAISSARAARTLQLGTRLSF